MEWSWKSTGGMVQAKHSRGTGGGQRVWILGSEGPDQRQGAAVEAGRRAVDQILREQIYQCGFCKGSGMISREAKCPVCKGRGAVSITNPPAVVCAFCRGTGRAKRGSTITCLACKGKGIVPVSETTGACPKCGGSGKEPDNRTLPCRGCNGAGVVSVGKGTAGRIRSPSGSERQAAKAIYTLGGMSGRTQVGREIGVSSEYSDYILKSMLQGGYLEKVSRDLYALTPECEKVIAELVKKDEEKRRIEEEKEKAKEKEQVATKSLIAPWRFV